MPECGFNIIRHFIFVSGFINNFSTLPMGLRADVDATEMRVVDELSLLIRVLVNLQMFICELGKALQ